MSPRRGEGQRPGALLPHEFLNETRGRPRAFETKLLPKGPQLVLRLCLQAFSQQLDASFVVRVDPSRSVDGRSTKPLQEPVHVVGLQASTMRSEILYNEVQGVLHGGHCRRG